MNVLLCATCGTRLSEPVRRLDEMPPYPGWDGLPGPDGRRHGPASVPRGTYVVHPHPLDAVGLAPHADVRRLVGCCGPDGSRGSNHVCACGAGVAVVAEDCCSGYETRLVPDAVRVAGAA